MCRRRRPRAPRRGGLLLSSLSRVSGSVGLPPADAGGRTSLAGGGAGRNCYIRRAPVGVSWRRETGFRPAGSAGRVTKTEWRYRSRDAPASMRWHGRHSSNLFIYQYVTI